MITKQDAAILFAYSFKLVDKEGKEYSIRGIENHTKGCRLLLIDNKTHAWPSTDLNRIGADYWILKRPYSQLVETIQHEGKGIVPIDLFEIGDDGGCGFEFDFGNIKLIKYLQNIAKYDIGNEINYLPYPVVKTLLGLHFIELPEGTYKDIE